MFDSPGGRFGYRHRSTIVEGLILVTQTRTMMLEEKSFYNHGKSTSWVGMMQVLSGISDCSIVGCVCYGNQPWEHCQCTTSCNYLLQTLLWGVSESVMHWYNVGNTAFTLNEYGLHPKWMYCCQLCGSLCALFCFPWLIDCNLLNGIIFCSGIWFMYCRDIPCAL